MINANEIYNKGMENVKNTPVPTGQKFMPGDFVTIAEKLEEGMSHFESGVPAMVEYTYSHAYHWSDDIKSYSLLIRSNFSNSWESHAWYQEHQLTNINDIELIKKFKKEIEMGEIQE